jgi:ssDNA thymidine ADP-ribosyltransferase, DarT
MAIPNQPKIYHIVHASNLASIVEDGFLWSDSIMNERGGPPANIGMPGIKSARLAMPVTCHADTCVGQYVPFNFCPRSVMLNIISYANHPNLTYRGGQEPIIHLEADLFEVIGWANANDQRWAFCLGNARAVYATFRSKIEELAMLNWQAIQSKSFRDPDTKEAKQAEFLLEKGFPWHLIERIGYINKSISPTCEVLASITDALKGAAHRPIVDKCNDWYN